MAGVSTNGLPLVAVGQTFPDLNGTELVAVDTELASGLNPQSVAAQTFQIAALAAYMSINTVTSSTNAGTLSVRAGRYVCPSLSTAPGASATAEVLTNTLITAAVVANPSLASWALIDGTNTTPGAYIKSVVLTTSTATITVANGGNANLNGTVVVVFMVGSED